MWESIINVIKEFNLSWAKLSTSKKVGVGFVVVILISSLIGLGTWIGEKSYAPLYQNLQAEESIALVKTLQEKNIPYLVTDNGATISIPPEFIQQTMMELAVQGMPAGQRPGMELFDKESFGTSSYVQKINYVRALQGELSRTIGTLRSVRKSIVNISIPPKTSMFEKTEPPKASVVVELHPGKVLAKEEIRGIQTLVAGGVEGLRPERVSVVDNSGASLSEPGDSVYALSSSMMEHQKKVERDFERRIEDIVSRLVGQGNVVARVNAELDFDPVTEHETLYDPEQSVVKNEAKREDNMEGSRPTPGGVAGAEGALPGPASVTPEAKQRVGKTDSRTNYEISQKQRSKEKALGSVKRLSVAVLVNHGTKKDADGKITQEPISPQVKSQIEKLVKDAVGFVADRDSVSIENAAFATQDMEDADDFIAKQERRKLMYQLITYGTAALFIFLFFVIVVRPFIRWITGISAQKVESVLPKTVEEIESLQAPATNALPGLANLPVLEETVDLDKAEGELLREKIVSMINLSPNKAAQIVSEWLALSDPTGGKGGKR